MNIRLALIAGLIVCVAPSFASITLRYDSTDLGQNIDYVYNTVNKSGFAGRLNFTDLTNSVALQLFCADLDNSISGGQTYNADIIPTIGDAAYQTAGSIVANSYYSVFSNDDATALQIAVWGSVYGTNLATNSGGTFQLESTWYTNHASIIGSAIAMTNLGLANVLDANHYVPDPLNAGQGQIGPVPEPASMLAIGVGLVAMARRRRK